MTEPLDEHERRARIAMSRVAEPGDVDACRLVREHSAVVLLERLGAGGLPASKARDWAERIDQAEPDQFLKVAERVGARFICPGDAEWPAQLADLQALEDETGDRRGGDPFGLWVRGEVNLREAAARSVSLVGARDATAYGEHVAGDLAARCGRQSHAVISGAAHGIDAAAHWGALTSTDRTIAVLACGIDRSYPAANHNLLQRIAVEGLVVSEAAPGCVPSRSRFLVRNRLIAALSQGTVVVEAALRSGSLNTARWACDLGRAVMGVPGPVTSMASAGVHELLRQPGSLLVTDADEIIEHISPVGVGLAPAKTGAVLPRDGLDPRSRQLLDAVPKCSPASAASIAKAAGLQVDDVTVRLRRLGDLGLVTGERGRWRLGGH